MQIKRIEADLSVCKLKSLGAVNWESQYCFVGKTDEELSLVCETERAPADCIAREDGWKAFRLVGPLDFSLIGILSSITTLLAEQGIGIFALSTYDTDYVLIREENFDRALMLLGEKGYTILK